MSGRRAITLVARREIRERLRGKLFLISTSSWSLLVGGSAALPRTLSKKATYHVAVTAPAPPGLLVALERAAKPFDNAKVQLRVVATPAAGRQALETKKVDALLLLQQDRLIFRSEVDAKAAAVADIAVRELRHHLPPAAELTTATLHEPDKPKTTDAETLVAYAGSLLLLMSLAVYGQWVVSGVVEEKNSRVVEVILSTVRARDLLAGKVIGIGLLGLAQLAARRRARRRPPRRRRLPRAGRARRQPRARHPLVHTRLRPLRRRLRRRRRTRLAPAERRHGRSAGHLHAARRLLRRLRRPLGRRQRRARTRADRVPTHSAARPAGAKRARRRPRLGARTRRRRRCRDDLRARPARRPHLRRRAPALRPAPRPTRSNPARAKSLREEASMKNTLLYAETIAILVAVAVVGSRGRLGRLAVGGCDRRRRSRRAAHHDPPQRHAPARSQ